MGSEPVLRTVKEELPCSPGAMGIRNASGATAMEPKTGRLTTKAMVTTHTESVFGRITPDPCLRSLFVD